MPWSTVSIRSGVPKITTKPGSLFEQAAGQGNPYAENQLGYLCLVRVPQNFETALHWYQIARTTYGKRLRDLA